jgi:hypothetical protein
MSHLVRFIESDFARLIIIFPKIYRNYCFAGQHNSSIVLVNATIGTEHAIDTTTYRQNSKMHLKMLGRLLLFILCLRRTVCFASSSSPAPRLPLENDDGKNYKKLDHQPAPIRIASLNKYGGAVKYFDLVAEKNANDGENTAIRSSRIKNPRFVVTALRRKLVPALRTTFLPIGFPEKTPGGYFEFCLWSWIQDVSTQLRSVLATQKILEGIGVGREGATALSALFNFLVRDGCGMVASKSLIDLRSIVPISYRCQEMENIC